MTQGNDSINPVYEPAMKMGVPIQECTSAGLTKREYFAAAAMQGLCAEGAWSEKIQRQAESVGSNSSIGIAIYAVDLADALIAALNNPSPVGRGIK